MTMFQACDDVLTLQEAADILRIGIVTAGRLARSGRLPGLCDPPKLGRKYRISRHALDAYLQRPLTATSVRNA